MSHICRCAIRESESSQLVSPNRWILWGKQLLSWSLSLALQSSVHPFSQRKIDCNALSEIWDVSKASVNFITWPKLVPLCDSCWLYSLLTASCLWCLITSSYYSTSSCWTEGWGWGWRWGGREFNVGGMGWKREFINGIVWSTKRPVTQGCVLCLSTSFAKCTSGIYWS